MDDYGYGDQLLLSPGRSVGLRLVPTERDLRFAWEEMPQQVLDVQQQKVRESLHAALIGWAKSAGEASDYTDNVPLQCLHPVGHWYEVPNLLRNGTLAPARPTGRSSGTCCCTTSTRSARMSTRTCWGCTSRAATASASR